MRRWVALPLAGCCFAAGLVAASVLPSSPASAADASLVGRWHLDEIDANGGDATTTPDSSGHGWDAQVSSVELAAGRFGQALQFTTGNGGSGAIVRRPDSSFSPTNLTVLAWVKRSGSPGNYTYVLAKGAQDCTQASYGLYTGVDGGLFFYVKLAQGTVLSPDAGQAVWDGSWHAVAGSYDGQRVRLFVDGSEVGDGSPAQGSIDYSAANLSSDLTIGFYPGGPDCTAQYSGLIDEVELYDRALTPSELAWLASGGASPPELPPPGTTTTTTTTSTTTPTTTTTTPNPPPPPPPPPPSAPVARIVKAASKTLANGTWLSGASSVPAGRAIVQYDWDLNGDGAFNGKFDVSCGNRVSAMSVAFATPGRHRLGLRIRDAAGRFSTTTATVTVAEREATHAGSVYGPVADCENPGANNQPDRSDCVKTFAFGIVEVNSRGEKKDCFRITSREEPPAGLDGGRMPQGPPPGALRVQRVYHAEVDGPVAVNGLYVPVPEPQHSSYDSGKETIGLGRHQTLFGTYRTLPLDLSLKIEPDKFGFFKLTDIPLTGGIPKIGGLQPEANVTLGFVDRKTRVSFHLKLPKLFTLADGGDAEGTAIFLMSNEDGLVFDGGQLGPVDVLVGPIVVRKLQLQYRQSQDAWSGGAIVQLLPVDGALGLDAAPPPPDKGFGLKHGGFDHAGIGVQFPSTSQPQLFPGLFLKRLDVSLGVKPLRFTGSAGLTAAHVTSMDGEVFVAFASPSQRYQFPEDSGDLQRLSGRTLDSFTIAIGGTGKLTVPVVGDIPLVDGYLLYEYPALFEIAGGFKFAFSFFSVDGGLHGFLDGVSGKWNFDAGVKACLRGIAIGPVKLDFLCFNSGAVVSSKGLGFCTTVPVPFPIVGALPVPVGIGYSWGDALPHLMIFDCDYGPWQESVPEARRVLEASGRASVKLPSGLPSAMIRIDGVAGPPDVRLTGPGGKVISTASPPADRNVVVAKLAGTNATYVALRKPAGGSWSVTPQGTIAVRSISTSAGLTGPRIAAHVTGTGPTRLLAYRIAGGAGASVAFAERNSHTYHVLGTTTHAAGTLRFTPAPGTGGRREIVAEITRNGAPVRKLVVAKYTVVGTARLVRPRIVRVIRRRAVIVVKWRPVAGASLYAVGLSTPGTRTMLVVRKTTVRLTGVKLPATITVSALGPDGSRSPHASIRVKPSPGSP